MITSFGRIVFGRIGGRFTNRPYANEISPDKLQFKGGLTEAPNSKSKPANRVAGLSETL